MAKYTRIRRTGTGDARANSSSQPRPFQFTTDGQLAFTLASLQVVLLETDVEDTNTAQVKYQNLPSLTTYGLEPKENQVFQLTGTSPNKTWELMAA